MNKGITGQYLLRGRDRARELGRQAVVAALREAATDWDTVLRFTQWERGFTSTKGGSVEEPGTGSRREVLFGEYAAEAARYAASAIRPKRKGRVVSHGLSRHGGSLDAECEARTALFGDADEVGGWEPLKAALEEAGLAAVFQESGGSRPGKPRWHVEMPLARPLTPDESRQDWKAQHYRPELGFILGLLSEVGVLNFQQDGKIGFDPATDRLLQVMEVGCRRVQSAPVPQTVAVHGRALDWNKLLELTGYIAPPQRPRRPALVNSTGPVTTAAPNPNGPDLPLVRAFAHDGLVVRHRSGKSDVLCPFEFEHSSSTPGDTSTVIFHSGELGRFFCSHAHCAGRDRRDVVARLSAGAREVLERARGMLGRVRLRDQLRVQGQRARGSKPVRLGEVEEVIGDVLRTARVGELVVVIVPPGGGKSRASQRRVVFQGHGIYAVPTHRYGDEVERNFMAMQAKFQRRRGVLSARDAKGGFACTRTAAAAEIQRVGGSVPQLVCRRCPDRKQCVAGSPTGAGDIILLTHQLVLQARARRPGEMVIIDECPQLTEEVVLSAGQLAECELLLAGEFLFDTFDASYSLAMRLWVGVLTSAECGDRSLDEAGTAFFSSTAGRKLLDEVLALGRPLQWGTAGAPPVAGMLPHVLNMIQAYARPRTETIRAAESGVPLAEVKRGDSRLQRAADGLRLMRPLRALAEQVRERGESAVRWRGRRLVVRVLTPIAQDLQTNGGVVLDATPDLDELRALRGDLRVVEVAVADAAPVVRRVVYVAQAARKHLLRRGEPEWTSLRRLMEGALDSMKRQGAKRLLVVSFKQVENGLRTAANPCADLLERWKAEGGEIAFAHFGAQRGLNEWREFDGCATLGDPWPTVDQFTERAVELGIDENEFLRSFVARELAQAHGRLRAPSRTRPAIMMHFGTVAPLGWHEGNTEVVTVGAGRPRQPATVGHRELRRLVDALGGVPGAAQVAGCTERSLRRYLAGRGVPDAVLAKLRRAAA
jgi:hypothetical protein